MSARWRAGKPGRPGRAARAAAAQQDGTARQAAAQAAAQPEGTALPEGAGAQRPPVPPPALRIDALGKKCPIPIIMLAERIGQVPIGRAVEVLADDPAARTDVPAWCGLKSHQVLAVTDLPGAGGWSFLVQRSY